MKVYVSGPLHNDDPTIRAENITRAVDAGIELIKLGHSPLVPHLSYWMDLRQLEIGEGIVYEDWLRVDFDWIKVSDAMLFLGSSPGADRELALAEKLGLTIYRDILQVPHAPVREV